jgi:hypothetical protein
VIQGDILSLWDAVRIYSLSSAAETGDADYSLSLKAALASSPCLAITELRKERSMILDPMPKTTKHKTRVINPLQKPCFTKTTISQAIIPRMKRLFPSNALGFLLSIGADHEMKVSANTPIIRGADQAQ